MIYPTAYDTTVGKAFQMAKTVRAIQESAVRDTPYHRVFGLLNLNDEDIKTIPWFVVGSNSSESQIPFFNHPILVELVEKNEKVLCADIRPYASFNPNHFNDDDAIRIKNKIGLNLEKLRLSLNLLWLDKRPSMLREISIIPMSIFSNWISESITRRFGLSPKDQMVISIVCCFYYYSLFSHNDDLDDEEKNRLISSTMKSTRAPITMVEEILSTIKPMPSIKEFSASIKELVDNIRLENFDEGVLINLVIASWFGVEAKQLISVAMEHPPTWISIVYSSFTEKSYKNTVISKISQRYLGSKGENDFVRSLVSLVKEV